MFTWFIIILDSGMDCIIFKWTCRTNMEVFNDIIETPNLFLKASKYQVSYEKTK